MGDPAVECGVGRCWEMVWWRTLFGKLVEEGALGTWCGEGKCERRCGGRRCWEMVW